MGGAHCFGGNEQPQLYRAIEAYTRSLFGKLDACSVAKGDKEVGAACLGLARKHSAQVNETFQALPSEVELGEAMIVLSASSNSCGCRVYSFVLWRVFSRPLQRYALGAGEGLSRKRRKLWSDAMPTTSQAFPTNHAFVQEADHCICYVVKCRERNTASFVSVEHVCLLSIAAAFPLWVLQFHVEESG